MKIFVTRILLTVVVLNFFTSCTEAGSDTLGNGVRSTIKLNDDWRFKLGDALDYKKENYNDSSWRNIDLPHDWGVEGTYDTIHGTDWQSGYLPAGIGWYRKDLTIDVNPKNHNIELQFDGVYRNSSIYVNGNLVGEHRYGYTGFFFAISKFLVTGKNSIAVRVDHSKPKSGRWYTGSGIYRNVWLRILPKAHFQTWEQSVTTNFLNDSVVGVNSNFKIKNESAHAISGKFIQKIYDSEFNLIDNKEKSVEIPLESVLDINEEIKLETPELWSIETPKRHFLVHELYDKQNNLIDTDTLRFGVRKIEFSAEWGFKLNNENTKIKGVCMHHAAGIYGAAVPESILLHKLQMLKTMGCNAIRTAHNPFSPEFYTMCDELGILVLDEIFDGWEKEKAEDDYGLYFEEDWQKDVTSWVKNNRNHPSIFMYSIGNEVSNPTSDTQLTLMDFIKNLDGTRPITQGGHDPTRGMVDQLSKTQLDVKGFNGDGEEIGRYESYHSDYPTVPIIATEVPHTYQTRGVYRTQAQWRRKDFPAIWEIKSGSAGTMRGLEGKCYPIADLSKREVFPEEKTEYYTVNDSLYPIINPNFWKEDLYHQSSYDNATVRSSARKAWQKVEELDYVMGQFRWTGFDYLGETNQWPSRFANFGIIDIANLPKDHYYLYQSLWSKKPMVHMLPHWTHPGKEGVVIPVVVYTNSDEVELFLNDISLGKQTYSGEQLVWNVPYEEGKMEAKAYNQGKLVAEKSYATASGDYHLRVTSSTTALSATAKENALIYIDVVDSDGNLFPQADNYITVDVQGAGKLKGLDNGNPIDLTSYSASSKRAFKGRLVAFIEAESFGEIIINIIDVHGNKKNLKLNTN